MDPWNERSSGGGEYYLRSENSSSLAIAATTRLLLSPDISVKHALAYRCEQRWHDLPHISLESILQDPSATARWLAEHCHIAINAPALEIIAAAADQLRRQPALLLDPVGFFEAIPLEEARTLLRTPSDRFLSTGVAGGGLASLNLGWQAPDKEGSLLLGSAGALKLFSLTEHSTLQCFCLTDVNPDHLSIRVDGNKTPFTWNESVGRQLSIPLPLSAFTDQDRAITVEFIQAGGQFGLAGFRLCAEPKIQGLTQGATFGEALLQAGFVRQADQANVVSQDLDGVWLETLASRRETNSLLVIAADARALLQQVQLGIFATTLIAGASIESGQAEDAASGLSKTFQADFSDSPHWPPLVDCRFDLIHLHHLASFEQLAEKLPWLARHLSFRGILSGCERTIAEARHVVAALGRGVDQYRFTFLLEGPRWRAFPNAHWTA